MDDSAAECADESRGVAFGKFCLWEGVSHEFGRVVGQLLIPPVEELPDVR